MNATARTRARPSKTGIAATAWSRSTTAAAAVTAGLLVSASFAPLDWWCDAIIGLALLGWLLTRRATTTRGALGCALVFGLAFYLPLLPWTGAFVGPAPYLALSTVCAVFPVAFAVLTRPLRGSVGWPLWWAACWVAVEWLKTLVPFGGFPWGVLAYGQTDGPLAAFARLGGAPLVSFATAWAGFSVAAMIGRVRTAGREWRREAIISAVSLIVIGLGACRFGPWCVNPRRRRPPRSPSPSSRATCPASAWTSTPSAALFSTITSPRRFASPRTCPQAASRHRGSSSGPRTPPTSTPSPTTTRDGASPPRPRRSTRRSSSGRCCDAPSGHRRPPPRPTP